MAAAAVAAATDERIRCPHESDTCAAAAAGGHLRCLRYAHENGCPWDFRVRFEAAVRGHRDCLMYAERHGCPSVTNTDFRK